MSGAGLLGLEPGSFLEGADQLLLRIWVQASRFKGHMSDSGVSGSGQLRSVIAPISDVTLFLRLLNSELGNIELQKKNVKEYQKLI